MSEGRVTPILPLSRDAAQVPLAHNMAMLHGLTYGYAAPGYSTFMLPDLLRDPMNPPSF